MKEEAFLRVNGLSLGWSGMQVCLRPSSGRRAE